MFFIITFSWFIEMYDWICFSWLERQSEVHLGVIISSNEMNTVSVLINFFVHCTMVRATLLHAKNLLQGQIETVLINENIG